MNSKRRGSSSSILSTKKTSQPASSQHQSLKKRSNGAPPITSSSSNLHTTAQNRKRTVSTTSALHFGRSLGLLSPPQASAAQSSPQSAVKYNEVSNGNPLLSSAGAFKSTRAPLHHAVALIADPSVRVSPQSLLTPGGLRSFNTSAFDRSPPNTLSSAYRSDNPEWAPYTPSHIPDSGSPRAEMTQPDFSGVQTNQPNQNVSHQRRRGKRNDRQDPLTALMSTLSYSYLARTAQNEPALGDAVTLDGAAIPQSEQLAMPISNQSKKPKRHKKKVQGGKQPLSAALDLDKVGGATGFSGDGDHQFKLRSNIISADAVTKSVRNVFRQFGVNHKVLHSKTGIEAILQRATDRSHNSILDKIDSLQHDLDLNRDLIHEEADPLGPYATGQISSATLQTPISSRRHHHALLNKANTTDINDHDGENHNDDGVDDNEPDSGETDGHGQNPANRRKAASSRKKNSPASTIKDSIPALQHSIFAELDGIVEFANLHYDNVLKALSQHSLSNLYPPELLTVEFFDYRLELFTDAIAEDLGALYKAKKIFYFRHLDSLKQQGVLSEAEYNQKTCELAELFSATVFDLHAISKAFQKIQFQCVTTLDQIYGDSEVGWTSHDTTFVRNKENSLEDELRLVEAVSTSLGQDLFSVNQFKQGLNIAAHRYPGLNVSIDKYIQQLSYEHQSITRAVDDYTELTDQLTKMGRASHLSPLQDHVLRWFKPLAESIEKEITECRVSMSTNKPMLSRMAGFNSQDDDGDAARKAAQHQQHLADLKMILPYISLLKSTELGCIALHETLSRILNAPSGIRVIDISLAIGKVVNTEANLLQLRQDRVNFQRLRRYYPGAKLNEQVIRRAVNNQNKKADGAGPNESQPILDPFGHKSGDDNAVWSDLIQAKVGSFLIKHMLQSSSIRQQVDTATGRLVASDSQFVPTTSGGGSSGELEVPAFIYEHRSVGTNFIGYLSCHSDVRRVIDKSHTDVQALAVRLLPMVIPPRPWRGVRDGGYLSVPSAIIRSKGSRKQVQAVEASDVKSVQDSLNYLGRVAWGINPNVLDVIDQAWAEGGGLAAMPSRRDIPVPPQPTLNLLHYDEKRGRYFTPSQQELSKSGSLINTDQLAEQTSQWRQWQRDTQRISQYNADLHSLRCDLTLRLNQAKQLAGDPVYFPLNMDFRGRAYPIPPHLNHLGADLARALLLFHHKKPLGPKGLYWLQAHLAAQFGVDKVSFDDRVKYIGENLDLVRDTATRPMFSNVVNPHYGKLRSLDQPLYPIPREVQQKYARVYIRQQLAAEPNEKAQKLRLKQLLAEYEKQDLMIDMSIEDDPAECIHPLDGERDVRSKVPWWQLADNPWQALSTCCEIIAAIDSGDPESYETGLPVHQDGSCNGLQHYAALGRDYAGGSRVNLTKSDKPQDVYSHVLHEVKRRMEQDIKDTDNPLAKMLLPHMARKVVKQTVMTSVYGVTFIGARDQILKQLRDLKDVPWEKASALVLQQQIENRKKYLKRQAELEQKTKSRTRATLMKNMTEAERVEFLNQEMLEQTLANDAMDILGDDPLGADPLDQAISEVNNGTTNLDGSPTPQDVLVEGQPAVVNDEGLIRAPSGTGDDKDVLMTQRQAQEAAMRASSIYLARLTLTSLGTVFSAATRIMSWLTECAGVISKQEQPVSWITPLNLPVVQHYRLISKYQVKTLNQTVTLHHDNDTLPVSPARQRAAFPPNFVHSLDATHMMLTAAQCAQHGLVFSSVHDSYWTHPGDVDKMNALLRDRFIHLYSGPILEDLRESFILRYPSADFPPLPELGDLDLELVRESPYFFS